MRCPDCNTNVGMTLIESESDLAELWHCSICGNWFMVILEGEEKDREQSIP